ncbi:hypothetical protein DEO72_LG9g1890 [Vigna unguiculata]|uniref:Uncharacterized protein n=1 Tax=Vigna unguiculata TaxID=3917 RepID=A0A4D6MZH8_VIGUN|nr:hypothetical protein DEO72_LG9g1890 [Vigna unguiculata]
MEDEDDRRNPCICEEEEEKFRLCSQPRQAAMIVRGGRGAMFGVVVHGTTVIEMEAALT